MPTPGQASPALVMENQTRHCQAPNIVEINNGRCSLESAKDTERTPMCQCLSSIRLAAAAKRHSCYTILGLMSDYGLQAKVSPQGCF